MQEYEYVGIDLKGKTCRGKVSANSLKSARSNTQALGLTILKIKQTGSGGKQAESTVAASAQLNKKEKAQNKLKQGAKGERVGLELLKRLYELHASGMPVADAIKLLHQRLSDPQQKFLAGVLWRDLSEGRTLSRAMRNSTAYFSESSTYVIEAGEATGNLAPILKKIIAHLEEKKAIRSKVLSGMSYPIFVCLVALGVVLFFLFFLLPQIEEMLATLGGEVALIVGGGIVFQWSKTPKGGELLDKTVLKLPLFGKILFLSELFQLSSLLSTLMWSGIGLTENLRLCERTVKNRFLRTSFRSARIMVNEGKSLPDALRKFELMPVMQLDVIEVGERTGNLGNSLNDISVTFRDQLTQKIKTMTSLVSGLALGFAFSLVAIVAISIVTSIFQVSKSISF